jgi:hypothetical protein
MAYVRSLDDVIDRRPLGREVAAGALAGQVAGLAMVVVMMALFSVFLRESPFSPVEAIAAAVLGEHVVGSLDARTLIVGVLVHQLGPALFWGVFFGAVVWLVKPRRGMALMLMGLLVGALAQIVDIYLVLPALSRHAHALGDLAAAGNVWTAHVPPAVSWIGHLMFGAALSFYPWKYDPMARAYD